MDVLEGRVEIPGGDFELDVPQLVKVVRDNGFTVGSLQINATGILERTNTGYAFMLQESNARYLLNQNAVLDQLLAQSQDAETPFNIFGTVVIPPPKGEPVPDEPVGSLTLEKFVAVQ